MHLYLFVRGKVEQIAVWEALAQSVFWKWRRINKETGEEEITLIQGSLRRSVLGAYEYIFPKEALIEVCSFFGIFQNDSYGFGKLGLNTRHFALRKIFGAKKIPKKILEDAKKIPPTFTTDEFERGGHNCIVGGVGVHPIGIKEDIYGTMPHINHYQELL